MFQPIHFGKYVLTERIAVGGMAEIFKAKLFGISGFEKPMVVKQILPQYARNDEFIKMFVNEAKIAVSLTHGNIVPIYELGRIEDTYFIAMEYVPGKDLAKILETARDQHHPLSPEHAVFLAIEICKGLDYAHRRTDDQGQPLCVVHRDISPPNVLVSIEGEVKITDFGIAKATHRLGNTDAGVVKGTFGYMSPEQVCGLRVDHRTDIFSTGILLHEMLTGRRLFAGKNDLEATERAKAAKITAPSSINPRVPAAIDPILFKALARDPADRYASASDFQLALSRFLFTSGTGATASTLSQYMKQLFGEEPGDDTVPDEHVLFRSHRFDGDLPAPAGTPPPPASMAHNLTMSYAVRPEFQEATEETSSPAPTTMGERARMDMGGGTARTFEATMAMPSLAEEPQAQKPVLAFDETGPTSIYHSPSGLKKPKVPKLSFSPAEAKPADRSPRSPLSEALPATGELVALADGIQELDVPSRPSTARLPRPASQRPAATPGPPATATPGPPAAATPGPPAAATPAAATPPPRDAETSQPQVLAEAVHDKIADLHFSPLDQASRESDQQPASVPDARPQPPRRARKVSGALSYTMKLFVAGLGDEGQPGSQESLPVLEGVDAYQHPEQLSGSSTALEVPRTIKPTVLGWILIGLVVLGASLFVVYKKTNWLSGTPDDENAQILRPEDFKQEQPEQVQKGNILLSSSPPGAHLFLFLGETPLTMERLDLGEVHVLYVEREGYRGVYRTIEPRAFSSGKATLHLTLDPVGAGDANAAVPATTGGTPTGETGTVEVTSDPPKAMVWRLIGQGSQVELPDVDIQKSYYFKAVLPGHRPGFARVSAVDFKDRTGTYSTTIKLEPEARAAGADTAPPEPDQAVRKATLPKPEVRAKTRPAIKARRARPTRYRRRAKARTKQMTPVKKPTPARKEAPGRRLPSWAQ